jgi:hypothetical protein
MTHLKNHDKISNEVKIDTSVKIPEREPTINSRHLHTLLKASYAGTNEAERLGAADGFKLDKELSNRKHRVFTDKHDDTYIAFTGSRTLGDAITDGLLAVGLADTTYRFGDSTRLIDKVKKKHPNGKLITIGDSLGATLAEHVNKTGKVDKVITHNKGVGILGIGKHLQNNQTDLRSTTDWVSALSNTQSGGKKLTTPGTILVDPLYAHSFNNIKKFGKKTRF